MKVILAEKAGFCFGVKRAVETAVNTQTAYNKKIYTLGPLIHNNDVVKDLEQKNIFSIELEEIDALTSGDVIIIRSHGISPKVKMILEEKNLIVVDATCPYVSNIHEKVSEHFKAGYQIVIVGDASHPEVIGINGCCGNTAIISKDGTNIHEISPRVCVVSQTTEKQENWRKVLLAVNQKAKEIITFNTICKATEVRQKSAEELSKTVDIMFVIGGSNSSNTTKLWEICNTNCKTIHIENASEIPNSLLNSSLHKIGVTAGASTPDWIIKEAIKKMEENKNYDMNEWLAMMDQNAQQVREGNTVKGTIISVNEKEAFINLGYKVDGILPKGEVLSDDTVSLKDILTVGEEIELKVVNRRNDDGYIVLSRKEIERGAQFKKVKEAFENKTPLSVKVTEVVKGGISANYNHVRIFIPASLIDFHHVDDLNQFVGTSMDVAIIEFSEGRRGTKIIGSRKELLKDERKQQQEAAWNSLNQGDVLEGEIKRLATFGAFVEVNGIDGLLHISEISYGRLSDPKTLLKEGQKVKIVVLEIDREQKKLSLSMKRLLQNPWEIVDEKYAVGSIIEGKVVRFAKFGAFVELEPGVDGLVHISQISNARVNAPEDVLQVGETVKVKVLEVNKEDKKISLSIKQAAESSQEENEEK